MTDTDSIYFREAVNSYNQRGDDKKLAKEAVMALPADKKAILELFESLRLIRKGTEDDFELRASADEKVWGVRMFDDSPAKPTFVIYAGADARELACDAADYDAEDDEETLEDDFDDKEDEEDDDEEEES